MELYIELLNKVNPNGLKGYKIEPLCEEDAKLLLECVENELASKQESEFLSTCINMWNFSCARSTNVRKTPIDIECLESLKLGDMSKKSLAEFLKSYGFGSFDAYFWITLIYSYVNSTDGSIGSYYSNNQNSLNSKKCVLDKEGKLSKRIKDIDNELKEYLARKSAKRVASDKLSEKEMTVYLAFDEEADIPATEEEAREKAIQIINNARNEAERISQAVKSDAEKIIRDATEKANAKIDNAEKVISEIVEYLKEMIEKLQ